MQNSHVTHRLQTLTSLTYNQLEPKSPHTQITAAPIVHYQNR